MNADNPMEVMAYAQNNGGPRTDCGKPNDEYWCDVAKWYAGKLSTALAQLETTGAEVDAAEKHAADQAAIINGLQSGLDDWHKVADERAAEIVRLQSRLRASLDLAAKQAEDEGLWFQAQTAPEAYLQQELRKLHAAIEGSVVERGEIIDQHVLVPELRRCEWRMLRSGKRCILPKEHAEEHQF